MKTEQQIACLSLQLEFLRVREHTERVCVLRGFVSDTHDAVIKSCINNEDILSRAKEIPFNVWRQLNDVVESHKKEVYMSRPRLRLVQSTNSVSDNDPVGFVNVSLIV